MIGIKICIYPFFFEYNFFYLYQKGKKKKVKKGDWTQEPTQPYPTIWHLSKARG